MGNTASGTETRSAMHATSRKLLALAIGLGIVAAAAGLGWALTTRNQPVLLASLAPLIMLAALACAHAPEISVGLLQGGMSIVQAALSAVGLGIPKGWTLPLFSGLSVLGLLYHLGARPQRWRVYFSPLSLLMLAQGFSVALGATYSWNLEAEFKALLFLGGNLVSYLVGVALTRSQRQRVYTLLLIVAVIVAVGLFASFVTGGPGALRGRYGTFGIETISAGRLAGLGLVILVFSWKRTRTQMLAVVVLGSGLLLAASRGPVVALILAVLLHPAIRGRRLWTLGLSRRTLVLLAGLVLAFLLLVWVQQTTGGVVVAEDWGPFRLFQETTPDDPNILGRGQHLAIAWQDFWQRPLMGWGTAGYGGSLLERDRHAMKWPHNMTLEILAEYGLFGFAIYVLILFWVYWGRRTLFALARWRSDPVLESEAVLLSGILVYTFLNAHVSMHLGTNRTVWLAIGLLEGLRYDAQHDASVDTASVSPVRQPGG